MRMLRWRTELRPKTTLTNTAAEAITQIVMVATTADCLPSPPLRGPVITQRGARYQPPGFNASRIWRVMTAAPARVAPAGRRGS